MIGEDWQKRAALEWQIESGVSDTVEEKPINRYALSEQNFLASSVSVGITKKLPHDSRHMGDYNMRVPAGLGARADKTASASWSNPVGVAETLAQDAKTLDALAVAQESYSFCDIKKGAQKFVFADGQVGARVMIVGEAPGRDEDIQGKPFVGQAGQLLDRMFAAIDMGRNSETNPLYITNVLPWRPPKNYMIKDDEIEMMKPFLLRHIELSSPKILILMGNIACKAILNRQNITRIRGTWFEAMDKPILPMLHPAYLLRNPVAKAQSWQDMLSLKNVLEKGK